MFKEIYKIFFLSFQLIQKKIVIYIILSIQMIISIIVFIGIVGKVQVISDSQKIIETLNRTNNLYSLTPFFLYSSGTMNSDWIQDILNLKEIESIGEYRTGIYLVNGTVKESIEYGDSILNIINIDLVDGEWFNKHNMATDYIPVIAKVGSYKVNDVIVLSNSNKTYKQKAIVIGTIAKDEYILTLSSGGSSVSYLDLIDFCKADLILPHSKMTGYHDIKNREDNTIANLFVFSKEGVSDDRLKGILEEYGSVSSVNQMKQEYISRNREYFRYYGVALLIFTLISSVGIAGINGIINVMNQKKFAIYFIIGLTAKQCAFIEAIRTGILLIATYVSTILIVYNTKIIDNFHNSMKINFTLWCLIFIYLILIYMITSWYFIKKLTKENLIEVYKKNQYF